MNCWRSSIAVLWLAAAASVHGGALRAPLADAAERMDRPAIRALLQQRADVNTAQVDGMTALHWVAHHDDLEGASLLVRAGADVKAASRYGVTPLSLACTNGNADMVALLLKAGADPNAVLPGGETALMTASRTGSVSAVKALLSHGAKVESRDDRRGQTALMWAAAEGHAAGLTLPGIAAEKHFGSISMNIKCRSVPQSPQQRFRTFNHRAFGIPGSGMSR